MRQKFLVLISTATACYVTLSLMSPAGAATFLSFTSERGDYIGRGKSVTLTRNDGYFRVSSRKGSPVVHFGFKNIPNSGNINSWDLLLTAPEGKAIVPGNYQDAIRLPSKDSPHPGLDFDGNGRGCNTLKGNFNVQKIDYNSYGELANFQADFEQHCEGAKPALFGQVSFDRSEFDAANLAQFLKLNSKIQEYPTALYYFSQPGDSVGDEDDNDEITTEVEKILTPEDVDFTASKGSNDRNEWVNFSINDFDRNSSKDIGWDLILTTPKGTALIPGLYERATRSLSHTQPGLEFSSYGRGCNQLGGRFQIIEADYGSEGAIKKFDALFEQHCNDELALGPALFGRIRYNASVTPTSPKSVPEPAMILGILGFGAWLVSQPRRTFKLRQRKHL